MKNGREVKSDGHTKKFGKIIMSPLAKLSPKAYVWRHLMSERQADIMTGLRTIS